MRLIDLLGITLILTVWIVIAQVTTSKLINYNEVRGHNILVQIDEHPDAPLVAMNNLREWTLYGDGTLFVRADTGNNPWHAQLSRAEVQHILDVVVHQNAFFDCTKQVYGRITPQNDGDDTLLTVDTNGRHKAVYLAEPFNAGAVDTQTKRVFTIERFLFDYRPAAQVFVVSPAVNFALLVLPIRH